MQTLWSLSATTTKENAQMGTNVKKKYVHVDGPVSKIKKVLLIASCDLTQHSAQTICYPLALCLSTILLGPEPTIPQVDLWCINSRTPSFGELWASLWRCVTLTDGQAAKIATCFEFCSGILLQFRDTTWLGFFLSFSFLFLSFAFRNCQLYIPK